MDEREAFGISRKRSTAHAQDAFYSPVDKGAGTLKAISGVAIETGLRKNVSS